MAEEYLNAFEPYTPYSTAIMIRGSRAMGFSDERSDLDAVIISESIDSFNININNFIRYKWNNIVVEALVITKSQLNKQLEILNKDYLDQEDLDNVERVLSGRIIYGSIEDVNFSIYRERYKSKYIEFKLDKGRSIFSKIRSHFDSPDYQLIYLCRKLMVSTIEASLASSGDIFTRERWLFKRLHRTYGENSTIMNNFIDILFKRTYQSNDEIIEGSREILIFSMGLQLNIYTKIFPESCIAGESKKRIEPKFMYVLNDNNALILSLNNAWSGPYDQCLITMKEQFL